MLKRNLYLILLLSILFSCKKELQKEEVKVKKSDMSISRPHSNSVILDTYSSKKVKNWKEYTNLSKFMQRFENTSPNIALNNALELKELVKSLKDSIRIPDLKTPAFRARVNVLENETLRLADMTYITAITANEINMQVDKIFLTFKSLNNKINIVYKQQVFDESVDLTAFKKFDSVLEKQDLKSIKAPIEK